MSIRDFQVLEELGNGVFSTVYKVHRLSDGQVYALKQVKLSSLNDKEKENALTEIRILASVTHRNVIAYKEAFIDAETDCLCTVMEYADGGDLFSKIEAHKKNKTRFSEAEVWDILVQAALGLKALHDLKIMHRDLKSANIFVTSQGVVKLADMNVSKVMKNALVYTQTGTPYYASPEVWKDQPYDYKSDVWSLGCVVYELAALLPPFRANDMSSLFRKVIKGDFMMLPIHYSNELNELLKQMLKVNPIMRPTLGRLLTFPSLQRRISRYPISGSNEDRLIQTIHMPRNLSKLAGRLPRPNYVEPNTVRKKKKRSMHSFTPKFEIGNDPKRFALRQKIHRVHYAPDKPRVYHKRLISKLPREETIAHMIKELKEHYALKPASPGRRNASRKSLISEFVN